MQDFSQADLDHLWNAAITGTGRVIPQIVPASDKDIMSITMDSGPNPRVFERPKGRGTWCEVK